MYSAYYSCIQVLCSALRFYLTVCCGVPALLDKLLVPIKQTMLLKFSTYAYLSPIMVIVSDRILNIIYISILN